MEQRIYLNRDWKFTEHFTPELLMPSFDATILETVQIPHNHKEIPFNYVDEMAYQMIAGYYKVFKTEPSWKGKVVLLTFEGAAHEATVYLNGREVAIHQGGYTAFTLDISPYLKENSDNRLVVKLDSRECLNIPPFGNVVDYLTYGGIYRDVYLEVKNPCYIEDVFVRTSKVQEIEKQLEVEVTVNHLKEHMHIRTLFLKEDTVLHSFDKVSLKDRDQVFSCYVSGVENWEIEHPVLYHLEVQLLQGEVLLDTKKVRFGFREATFKKDGFYLNGKKIKLRGLNRHQAYPYVGYAMPKSPQRRDANLLKNELGLNAVRTSHYPQSQYFIDCCDEIGLLVFTEIPGWQHIGDDKWKEIACKNVAEMVTQYRNHPSIILWGVRINESPDDDSFYEKTNQIAHELDKSRQTGGVRCIKNSHLLEDVYTYNDFIHDGMTPPVDSKKKVSSNQEKAYLIAEYNGHMYPTKSYDSEPHRLEHALRHARVIDAVKGREDIVGSFGWCMFDYNTHKDFGSGDRICHHGVMDMFRNPKLAAAVYKSQQDIEDFLEISSSMDIGEHPGGFVGSIYMFTNADEVRVYKNDEWITTYDKKDSPFKNLKHGPLLLDDLIGNQLVIKEGFSKKKADGVKKVLNAAMKYGQNQLPLKMKLLAAKMMLFHGMKLEDGPVLYGKYIGNWGGKVTTYRFEAVKNGKVVKTIIKKSTEKVKLEVEVDHTQLIEDHTYDVASIRIKATDENGNVLCFYQEPLSLKVEGDIALIGPKEISLKGGMGGTYIKTIGKEGKGRLIMSSTYLEEVVIDFTIEEMR